MPERSTGRVAPLRLLGREDELEDLAHPRDLVVARDPLHHEEAVLAERLDLGGAGSDLEVCLGQGSDSLWHVSTLDEPPKRINRTAYDKWPMPADRLRRSFDRDIDPTRMRRKRDELPEFADIRLLDPDRRAGRRAPRGRSRGHEEVVPGHDHGGAGRVQGLRPERPEHRHWHLQERSDKAEQKACLADAKGTFQDDVDTCKEQRAARKDVCGLLGNGPYEPAFDPNDFDTNFAALRTPTPSFRSTSAANGPSPAETKSTTWRSPPRPS